MSMLMLPRGNRMLRRALTASSGRFRRSRQTARALSTADAGIVTSFVGDLDRVLGIGPDSVADGLAPELEALLEARAAARTARNWAESDRLRDELARQGIVVEDTRDGQRWRRLEDLHG